MYDLESIDVETIVSEKDISEMLDTFFRREDDVWWNKFYSDKGRAISFFTDAPDENLSEWSENGRIKAGKALEIGCGNGRNARFLARKGFDVTAIDFSLEAIEWAEKLAKQESLSINFECASIFDLEIEKNSFDFIYDSGCLHHIKPHRRVQYLEIVKNSLTENGQFGLVCFNPKGGANISDYDVYRARSMKGGLAFTREKLEKILAPFFNILEIREMKETKSLGLFGKDFLWTLLLRKR